VFGVTLRLLVIHVVVVSRQKLLCRLQRLVSSIRHGPTQLSVLHLALQAFTARGGARYWLRITISAYPHLHLTPLCGVPVGILSWRMVKPEWFGYPMVKKNWSYDYLFWQNVRTWQADGRTPRDGISRACIASRGKNTTHSLYTYSKNSIASLAFCCRAQPCYCVTGGVSVRLSIRSSHASIDSKLMTVGSRSFHYLILGALVSFSFNISLYFGIAR